MTAEALAPPPVRVDRLRRGYDELEVLRGISFEVRAGERFCIIGSNGAGKSTLLAVLAGLRRPDSGEVRLFGHDPTDPRLKALRGVQLERPYFPYYAKVSEVLWLFSSMHPRAEHQPERLQRFRLRPGAYVRHLSKGQRQRLAILLATLGDPRLMILDEPTSGLDPEVRSWLWREISRYLAEARERSLLFTTHDLREAEQWAHRVAMLHRGRIAAIGPPAELCRSVVGTERKLTVVPREGLGVERVLGAVPSHLFAGSRVEGERAIVYTDHPKKVIELLALDRTEQVEVSTVSLEDVFFAITRDEPDARAVA